MRLGWRLITTGLLLSLSPTFGRRSNRPEVIGEMFREEFQLAVDELILNAKWPNSTREACESAQAYVFDGDREEEV